jgi:PIN domain nuclease of toxin-antitoxin system
MPVFVLDASAILALLQDEPGADRVARVLDGAVASAVNLSEVACKLADHGMPLDLIQTALGELGLDIRPFDTDAAYQVAVLRPLTRAAGLSLGDRACLALAGNLAGVAITADRTWSKLDIADTVVEVIR